MQTLKLTWSCFYFRAHKNKNTYFENWKKRCFYFSSPPPKKTRKTTRSLKVEKTFIFIFRALPTQKSTLLVEKTMFLFFWPPSDRQCMCFPGPSNNPGTPRDTYAFAFKWCFKFNQVWKIFQQAPNNISKKKCQSLSKIPKNRYIVNKL